MFDFDVVTGPSPDPADAPARPRNGEPPGAAEAGGDPWSGEQRADVGRTG